MNQDLDQWEIHHPIAPTELPSVPGKDIPPANPKQPSLNRNSTTTLDRLFLNQRGDLTWSQMTGFRGGPTRLGHRLQGMALLAAAFDALLLISASSFFLLSFAAIVKNPVFVVLKMAIELGAGNLFLVFLALFSWLYLVGMRLLIGFTLGEWACDLRLGPIQQRSQASYPWKVLLRSTFLIATGGVTFPLLSFIFGRDLVGKITGLRIISLR